MAISRVKTWTTNEDLTSSDLNAEFNQVMNNAANTGSAETISARYTFSAGVILDELVATNAAGAGNIKISEFRWDPASGTAADGDGMYIDWVADDAGGTETIMARTGVELTDTDATGEDSEFEIHTMIAATLTKVASFGSAGTTFNAALTVGTDVTVGDDLLLNSDSAVLSLGAGADATLTHDGTEGLTIAANPITLDSGGSLRLDSHTGSWIFKDAGTEVLRFTESSSGEVTIKLVTDSKNLVFSDNGNNINMTILDAAAGINVPGEVQTTGIGYTDGDNAMTIADGGGVTFAAAVDINSGAIDGTTVGASSASTGAFTTLSATTLSATGDVSLNGGTFVFNEAGADKDFRIEGDSNQNLFFADASTDRVGIGTDSPGADLEVSSAMGTLRLASTDGAVDDDQIISKIEFWTTDNQFTGSGEGIAAQISAISEHSTGDDYGLQFMTGTDATATEKVRITNVGRVGIGETDPDGVLHLKTTSGTTASALYIESTVTDSSPSIRFKNDAHEYRLYAPEGGESDRFSIYDASNSAYRLVIESGGNVGIGETAPNALLSLNQGADDGVIFTAKSSDISHGITSGGVATVEADDYLSISKASYTLGGAVIQALAEDDSGNQTLRLYAIGGTANTTKTTGGVGLVNVDVLEHNGSNSQADITADGNVFSVRARVSGGLAARMIVDEDGDLYSVTSAQTFDDHDDVGLISAYDMTTAPDQVIRTDFEDFAKYNEDDLIKAGVLGDKVSEGGMTNVTQLQRLHNGAIRQLGRMLNETRMELAEARKEIKQLAA